MHLNEDESPLSVRSALERVVRRLGAMPWAQKLCDLGASGSLGTREELEDQRAFRRAAEAEIAALKKQLACCEDELRTDRTYLESLLVLSACSRPQGPIPSGDANGRGGDAGALSAEWPDEVADAVYPSCPWIEGGLSFIPGRLRVCPNGHLGGGTPGLLPFEAGELPVDQILKRRDVIRQANRAGCFAPCAQCAFLEARRWPRQSYAFNLVCIAHATACNLACRYCHAVPESLHLQNPKSVPSLLATFESLIEQGLLASDARILWGGGEPTMLREFEPLLSLLEGHGAYSEVYTSGVRVSPKLRESLRQDRAGIMVSLDAGTADTYRAIKGRALFDRVVVNVAQYAAVNPGRVILKMILSDDNRGEISSFLDVAERAGVGIVCYDVLVKDGDVDERSIEDAAFFSEASAQRGLECRIGEVGSIFVPGARIEARVQSFVDAQRLSADGTACQG